MILRSLTTRHFRNLEVAAAEFHPRANVLVGRNGQGKTNVLEAIYFLATTRSFRTRRLASLFRFSESSVYVSGEVERDAVRRTLSVGLESGESRRRVLTVQGEKVTLPVYLGAASVLAYSSARLDAIRGTPEERRRFLDRGVASVQASYLDLLSRYTRALKQRNALLEEIATGHESPGSLDAWDEELHAAAGSVHAARAGYVSALASALNAILERYRYHVRDIELRYSPSVTDELASLRRREIRARTTIVGPQRDVLEFFVDGRPASEVLSGGEQKMVVLLAKFAKIELFRARHEDAPVFVLDDIDAELDLEILQQLLTGLPPAIQVFATSAKEAFLSSLEAGAHRRLTLENGRITAQRDFA